MPDHKTVYLSEADSYDRLVSCEDFEGNILKNIEQVSTLVQKDVVEFGAGTGRLTTLLAPLVRSIQAFDSSSAMLKIAEKKLRIFPNKNWRLQQADNRSIPVPDHCADIVVSGWSICYFVSWSGSEWIQDIKKSLSEMKRILRTGGKIILLETMGTGFELPTPPLHLHEYYQLLTFYGFKSDWFRTDYKFASLPEAVDLVKFFSEMNWPVKLKIKEDLFCLNAQEFGGLNQRIYFIPKILRWLIKERVMISFFSNCCSCSMAGE